MGLKVQSIDSLLPEFFLDSEAMLRPFDKLGTGLAEHDKMK